MGVTSIDMARLTSLWDLESRWHLSRRITHGDGRIDTMAGTVDFVRSDQRLFQNETGILEVNEHRLEARQSYVWTETQDQLQVFFADFRPFHTLPLRQATPEAKHNCPPDKYHVRYDFTLWPNWKSTWTVEGPRKTYVMTSIFSKLPIS